MNRRDFLHTAALGSAASYYTGAPLCVPPTAHPAARMTLSFRPFTLELKHAFGVSVNTRTSTPIVLTTIQYGKLKGYGEASMPPYLGETQESVMKFLSKVNLSRYDNPLELETILADIDALEPGNNAAKASIDIALHDLAGKIMGQPLYNIWGLDRTKTPYTVFTIGIDTPEVVRKKVLEVDPRFKLLKIKLGRDNDREIIRAVRSVSDKPLVTDANQGWKDKERALDTIHFLKENGAVLIEQPLPKEMVDDNAWITERSPIPVIADESIKRLSDLIAMKGVYHGVNLKLMKTTGLREAHKMITVARAFGMKVMIGCMTETSCGITAAAHLTPLVDWADLDGALLSKNDVFRGITFSDGKIILPTAPGIGAVPR
ncbi:MAG: dipeptide epimerase [Bacteroidota bacterium]|nr:dipeptide epimerase [Candidatus Kapabacteria bacterium]MDW8220682.1 dipeptide epimerase [Bacteroidota bacterium]